MNGFADKGMLLLQILLMVIVAVGLYWKLRELIFKLHAENRERFAELEAKVNAVYTWWRGFTERRDSNRQERP